MDDSGTTKDDVKVPEGEVGEKITKMFNEDKDTSKNAPGIEGSNKVITDCLDVIVLTAMGEELAMDCKEAPRG